MATGKSSTARELADVTAAAVVDLDERIAIVARRSVAELFAVEGEAAFRSLEASELRAVLRLGGPLVVALGGGALLEPGLRAEVLAKAFVVVLDAEPQVLASRTAGAHGRPLLDGDRDPAMRLARIQALLLARAGAYADAHLRIRSDALRPHELALEVARAWLGWRQPGRCARR